MSSPDQAIAALRARIDALDAQWQTLMNQRAQLAHEIAGHKRAAGEQVDYYRAEREAEVLQLARARNTGPLADGAVLHLFRELMSACRALEGPLCVAFLGPEGTFSQQASIKHFGSAIEVAPQAGLAEVFRAVESGAAHYGVVPVENSSEGAVSLALDCLMQTSLKVCGEIELRVQQQLLSRAATLAGVRRVYSHQQSLAQCRGWLERHLPCIERVAVVSNAEAARLAAGEPDSAAIAGQLAAEQYQLPVLVANIEDDPTNTTRFLVIGSQAVPPSGRDKTSLLLSVRNQPGALHRLLAPLAEHAISMTRIESRPSRRGAWDYVFFIDIEGHAREPHIAGVIETLRQEAAFVKVLGSYPQALG